MGKSNIPNLSVSSLSTLKSLEGGVDAIYNPERDLERIHAKEWQEWWNENPEIKASLDVTHKQEMYEFREAISSDDETEESFLALAYFLEVAVRQRIPTTQGRLPTEIYRMIIACLLDTETYCACMDVSTLFRDLCQQSLRVIDNFVFLANGVPSGDLDSENGCDVLRTLHLPTGIVQEMQPPVARYRLCANDKRSDAEYFKVVFGSQRNRRTILPDMEVCLMPVERDE